MGVDLRRRSLCDSSLSREQGSQRPQKKRIDFAGLRGRNVEIAPIRKFFCADLSTTSAPAPYFLPQLAGGNGTYDRTSQASAALAMTRTVAGTASLASCRSRSGGMEVRRLSQTTATRPIRAIPRIGKAKGEVQRRPGAGDRATVSTIGNHRAAPAPGFPHFRKEGLFEPAGRPEPERVFRHAFI